jgi:hypothetical protein
MMLDESEPKKYYVSIYKNGDSLIAGKISDIPTSSTSLFLFVKTLEFTLDD